MSKKYCLFVGRWQIFHSGHQKLIETRLKQGKNVLIAVRDTPISDKDPYTFQERQIMIRKALPDKERVKIIPMLDIEEICFGRDVGYKITEIKLDPETEKISGTKIRNNKK